jgi:hypothetical protein
VIGAGASALVAVMLVSGCGSTSHAAQPSVTSRPGQSSPVTAASSPTSSSDGADNQTAQGQITAVEQDVSQAASADSQALNDLNAASSAQAQNDGP